MQRRVWVLQIRPGKEEAYDNAHRQVWPELIEASIASGFRNHSVFVHRRTVVAYLEAEDIDASNQRLHGNEVVHRWNRAMADLLEETDSDSYEEVFHFD